MMWMMWFVGSSEKHLELGCELLLLLSLGCGRGDDMKLPFENQTHEQARLRFVFWLS